MLVSHLFYESALQLETAYLSIFYVKDNTISSIPNFNGSQYVYLYNPR